MSEDVRVYRNSDGKAAVGLGLTAHRIDPNKPGVINYRSSVAFAWADNNDEAVGLGMRLARKEWPAADGWSIDVAVLWVSSDVADAIASTVPAKPSREGA